MRPRRGRCKSTVLRPSGRSLSGATTLGPLLKPLDAPWKDASRYKPLGQSAVRCALKEVVEKALCCVPLGRSLSGATTLGPLLKPLDAPWKDASRYKPLGRSAIRCALEEVVVKALCCVPLGRSLSGATRPGAFVEAVGCALEGRTTLSRGLLQQPLEGRITTH
jgi:phosphopantetheinyl transferase (holo-ACP synthase)